MNQRLQLAVNMHLQGEAYLPKKTIFTVYIHTQNGVKIAGTVNFNPAEYIEGRWAGVPQTLHLDRCPDKKAHFKAVFACRLLHETDWDRLSNASGDSSR